MELNEHIKKLNISKAEYARRTNKDGKSPSPQHFGQMVDAGWIVINNELYRPTGYKFVGD